jgi:formiminoglutamate deiminase
VVRVADGCRDAGMTPVLPEEFDAAATGLDGDGLSRLAVLIAVLDLAPLRAALPQLPAGRSAAELVAAFAGLARDTPLLTIEVLGQSELRVEELARRLVAALGADPHGMFGPRARAGAAIHSVRAVPPDQLHPVIAWAQRYGAPVHAHLSEQTAENLACLAAYRATPAEVLYDAGALGPRTTVVHATHLASRDIELLGGSRACACLCPTTEADLADGIGPARALASAGSMLSLGTDSQAVIDLFEEARRVELGERLATQQRGHFTAAELAGAATMTGHACLGWPDAGEIVPGALADLVTVALDGLRLAGTSAATALESVIFAATAADVRDVVVGGRDVVRDGTHLLIDGVPGALSAAVRAVLD